MGTPNRGGFGGAVGRAGTTRKRRGASIADIRAVRGGLGYGGCDGSGTPAGHFTVVDGTLVSTQEGTNRFMPRASARLILLAANSGFGGLPSRSLACPLWAVCPSKPTRPTPCQPMSARGTEEMIDWTRQMVGLLEQG